MHKVAARKHLFVFLENFGSPINEIENKNKTNHISKLFCVYTQLKVYHHVGT